MKNKISKYFFAGLASFLLPWLAGLVFTVWLYLAEQNLPAVHHHANNDHISVLWLLLIPAVVNFFIILPFHGNSVKRRTAYVFLFIAWLVFFNCVQGAVR
jgi:uncharacterized membrane protein